MILLLESVWYCNITCFSKIPFPLFTDVAMRYLVENVLKTRIDGGIRDSVRLRDRPPIREKSQCCKS